MDVFNKRVFKDILEKNPGIDLNELSFALDLVQEYLAARNKDFMPDQPLIGAFTFRGTPDVFGMRGYDLWHNLYSGKGIPMAHANTPLFRRILEKVPEIDKRKLSMELEKVVNHKGEADFLQSATLSGAFSWDDSPQGYVFWSTIDVGINPFK